MKSSPESTASMTSTKSEWTHGVLLVRAVPISDFISPTVIEQHEVGECRPVGHQFRNTR